jgi:leucyl-tRNA synthetase
MVNSSDELDIEAFKKMEDYKDAEFICDDNGKYIVGREIEKMSKSKYNVVTQMIFVMNTEQTLCVCTKMFLGPLETRNLGIQQVFRECLVS